MDRRFMLKLTSIAVARTAAMPSVAGARAKGASPGLWSVWDSAFTRARYMQAERVTNLDKLPATGALIALGFLCLKGGTGGFASFTAICPPDWAHGARPGGKQSFN